MALPITNPASERGRICAALLALVAARGFSRVDVESVCARAGVDPPVFYAHFLDVDACFTVVWEQTNELLVEAMTDAFAAPGPWRERIRAALGAGLRFLAAEPQAAALYVGDGLFAARPVRGRHQSAMRCLAQMIDRGREEATVPVRDPERIAEALAGGIWHWVHYAVTADPAQLPARLPEMTYFVVLPYLGREAAREELRRSP